ncbi:Hsp20/alpha crystallin family protein [Halorussus sp. AFM4]|uniref:Hsp20/alpha crystallin family protein n=1 Tax=Halorussus sp. AFM4 TaxID=3421651 RepID=UPI003EB9A3DF
MGQMTQRPRALHEDVSQQVFNAEPQPAVGPAVDVFDSAEEIVVVIDLPGFDPKTINLQAADQSLVITAERTLDDEEVSARSIQRERLPQIERAVDLPAEIDIDEAIATCENGVCRVTLPKAENARRKKISFESEAK